MRATSLGIQKLQVDWKFPSTIFTNLVKTILICTCIINSSEQCKTQSELISEIRANSTTNVFPVKDPSSTVDVEASIDFLHILNVNIVEQNIAVRIWAVMRWYNELVSWDVNEFCGVNDILDNGATDLLWFPDIILPQLASNQVLFKSNSAQMRIAANGKTFICRYATLDFTCNMNSIKFPYDLVSKFERAKLLVIDIGNTFTGSSPQFNKLTFFLPPFTSRELFPSPPVAGCRL